MSAFRPTHLSVSSIELFTRCPMQWRARYVHKRSGPVNGPLLFGKAFHAALEAEHRGDDADLAFISAWNAADADLIVSGQVLHPGKAHGLALLEAYRARGYGGQMGDPERKFSLPLPSEIVTVPLVGFIDLPVPGQRRFREFKTASGASWTDTKVALQHQLHVYGWAYQMLYRHRPECAEYVIFGTTTPTVNVIEARPSPDGFRLFVRVAETVWKAIEEERYDGCGTCDLCKPSHGDCGPTLQMEAAE